MFWTILLMSAKSWKLVQHTKNGYANLKYKYGDRHFWCRGYYVDTVGKYETAIRQYIRNQLQEDISNDQMSMKELFDPFTGEPEK